MPDTFNNAFSQGAQMFLNMQGIKNQREQQEWMRQLQLSQLGIQQERLGMEQSQMMMQIQKYQKEMKQEADRKSAVQRAMGVKQTVTPEGTIRERNIPAPGQESQFYGQAFMGAAGELGDIDMMKLAQGLMPKPDTSITEAEILMKGGPGAERYIAGKQRLMKPEKIPSMGNASEMAIMRKFQDSGYLTDPQKNIVAMQWINTEEGRQALRQSVLDLSPPGITIAQTSEGFVPITTRGPGIGTVHQPTGLKKPLSAEQLGKVGELNTILENINQTKQLFGYGTTKEHAEWIGPISGRKGGLEAKYLGSASTDQVKFYAYVKDMQDALLRARSGAQINEQEYARLVVFLPDPNLPLTTFKGRLDRFEEATKIMLNEKISAFGTGGYGFGQLNKPTQPTGSSPALNDFRKKYNY